MLAILRAFILPLCLAFAAGACSTVRTAYYGEPEKRFRAESDLSDVPVAVIETEQLLLEIAVLHSGRYMTSAGPAFCFPFFAAGSLSLHQLSRQTLAISVRLTPLPREDGKPRVLQLTLGDFSIKAPDGSEHRPVAWRLNHQNKRGLSGRPIPRSKGPTKITGPIYMELYFDRLRHSRYESYVLHPGVYSPAILLAPIRFTTRRDRDYNVFELPFASRGGPR